MRILYILVIQIFLLNAAIAQTFQIKWSDGLVQHSIGQKNFQVKSILNPDSYNDSYNLPHFYFNEKVFEKSQLKFNIVKEENIQLSALGDIKFGDIPNKPQVNVGVYSARGELHKVIDVNGLYKTKMGIKKIISFEILTTEPNNNEKRFYKKQNLKPILNRKNGKFYKISIDTTGVYKIDKSFLERNGISTQFNPKKFKIYGNGGMMLPESIDKFRYNGLQEVAIYSVGMEDGAFDENDYFLFYAQGPNGIDREQNRGLHSKNLYEDKSYYFINFEGSGDGKRMLKQEVKQSPSRVYEEFDQVLFYEKDLINIHNVGRLWVGESFYENPVFNIEWSGNGEIKNPALSYQMVSANASNTSFIISVNGNQVVGQQFSAGELVKKNGTQGFSNTTYPLRITLNVDNTQNPLAGIYLDYIRLNFKQNLKFNNQQLGFRWLEGLNEGDVYGFRINGNAEQVWDVSDRVNATFITPENNLYKFKTKSVDFPNEFIAFNQSQTFTPTFVKQIDNQSLTSLSGINYVIVSYPSFVAQAERLATAHTQVSGVKTAVVTTEQIYNEFSSGSQDISAIRDFFKFLYDDNQSLKYALLLGDSSYDFKDRIPNNTNMVPSYQSEFSIGVSSTYVTDDFYGILEDGDGLLDLSKLDIAVGRLPANSYTEAETLVDKTLSYLNANSSYGSPFGDWRSKITFVVDDDNPGKGNAFHNTVNEKSAKYMEENYPFYTVEKLYADAFEQVGTSAGVRYPDLERKIVNAIESGTLLVNYFGHGGVNGWSQERIFTQQHIKNLTNWNKQYSRLPILLTVTCDFTIWDIPQINSGGEMMIKNPNGGAVAMLTTSREIPVSYGLRMNDIIVKYLFTETDGKYLPIGEALRRAKVEYGPNSGFKLNLIGDPLISLARPQKEVRIDKINGESIEQFIKSNNEIKALDFVSVEGTVISNGAVDKNFNGNVSGTLFDKVIDKSTLNNDGNLDVLKFKEQTNAIYRGGSTVSAGKFNFQFYVPKDINFDKGAGKLLFYVSNGDTDGIGFNNKINVGGINPNGVKDSIGPQINLYMNNLNFANGGITDRNPYLLACLTDSTGINATGSGIGHDIIQLLDGNINNTTVLNEFFEGGEASPCLNPKMKDFQKGRVLYKLNELEPGEHTITFRAWDINNNSTTETLDFIVMLGGEQKLQINRLLNWPNPFTSQTYFHFEHNCPEALDVQVQIFTIAGKLVKTIRQTVSSTPFREGYRTDKFAIPWDGLDDYGNKIGKGVYIYKTIISSVPGGNCNGKSSAVEKLVILK